MEKQEQITRLQKEIDSFLLKYDPNNQEHILLLFAYNLILSTFCDEAYPLILTQKEKIKNCVDLVSASDIKKCVYSFDFSIYINQFLSQYGERNPEKLTREEVDASVYILLIEDGFRALATRLGEKIITRDYFIEKTGKRYVLLEYPVWGAMIDSYFERYNFDSDFYSENMTYITLSDEENENESVC